MNAPLTGFSPEVRAGILLRDGGLCAMLGVPGCDEQKADEANHRLNRGVGGSSDFEVASDPSNGCGTSHRCNWRLEHSAEFAEAGRRRGVKVEAGRRPESVPFWSVFFREWLVLVPEGPGGPSAAFQTGCKDETRDARLAVISGSRESGFEIEWRER